MSIGRYIRQRGAGMRSRLRGRAERGAVAVEFAFVLPLLLLLLLGTITGGLAFSRSIGLTNAVREGARFGATADADSGTWASDVLQRVRETQFDDSTAAGSSHTSVCVQLVGSSSIGPSCSSAGQDPPGNGSFTGTVPDAGDGCVVLVWARRNFHIEMGVFGDLSDVMHRESAARYERAC